VDPGEISVWRPYPLYRIFIPDPEDRLSYRDLILFEESDGIHLGIVEGPAEKQAVVTRIPKYESPEIVSNLLELIEENEPDEGIYEVTTELLESHGLVKRDVWTLYDDYMLNPLFQSPGTSGNHQPSVDEADDSVGDRGQSGNPRQGQSIPGRRQSIKRTREAIGSVAQGVVFTMVFLVGVAIIGAAIVERSLDAIPEIGGLIWAGLAFLGLGLLSAIGVRLRVAIQPFEYNSPLLAVDGEPGNPGTQTSDEEGERTGMLWKRLGHVDTAAERTTHLGVVLALSVWAVVFGLLLVAYGAAAQELYPHLRDSFMVIVAVHLLGGIPLAGVVWALGPELAKTPLR
jgi:hypothetical protein